MWENKMKQQFKNVYMRKIQNTIFGEMRLKLCWREPYSWPKCYLNHQGQFLYKNNHFWSFVKKELIFIIYLKSFSFIYKDLSWFTFFSSGDSTQRVSLKSQIRFVLQSLYFLYNTVYVWKLMVYHEVSSWL